MKEITRRIIRHIGLDHSPFNVECFWDEASDDIKLLEINARISKSHSPLFELVDGASHHEVAIDIALARPPEFPRGAGEYRYAAKFMPRVYGHALVTRVPKAEDMERLRQCFPEAQLAIHVREG